MKKKTHTLLLGSIFSLFSVTAHATEAPTSYIESRSTRFDLMNDIRQQGRRLATTEIQAVEAAIQGLATDAINPAFILLICPESAFSAIHSGHAEKAAHFFQTLSENQRKVLFAKLIGNDIPDQILRRADTRGLLSRQLFETLGDPLQKFSPGSSDEHAKRLSLNRHLTAACDRRDLLPSAPPIFTGAPFISAETATESTAIGAIRTQGYTIPDAVKIYQHQKQNPNLTVEAAAAELGIRKKNY